jgi:hypothetical protein
VEGAHAENACLTVDAKLVLAGDAGGTNTLIP